MSPVPQVVDCPDRLRRTLGHELCHVGQWVVDHQSNPTHGPAFKAWAQKLEEYDPSLKVDVCHTYEIEYKYTYGCTGCGKEYGRHTNSINVLKKVCGVCRGRLEVTKGGEGGRPPSGFALFVSENFASARAALQMWNSGGEEHVVTRPPQGNNVARAAFGASPPTAAGGKKPGSKTTARKAAGKEPGTPRGWKAPKARGNGGKTPGPAHGCVMKLLSKMWRARKEGDEGGGDAEEMAMRMMTDMALQEGGWGS